MELLGGRGSRPHPARPAGRTKAEQKPFPERNAHARDLGFPSNTSTRRFLAEGRACVCAPLLGPGAGRVAVVLVRSSGALRDHSSR
jgi:hypothetical protein